MVNSLTTSVDQIHSCIFHELFNEAMSVICKRVLFKEIAPAIFVEYQSDSSSALGKSYSTRLPSLNIAGITSSISDVSLPKTISHIQQKTLDICIMQLVFEYSVRSAYDEKEP